MNRKLASIQVISQVKAHPNADRLDLATILGWQVVTKRNEFKQGDLCVFFEIDSIVPNIPLFEFMAPRKFRVRTIRLRKELSQGLVIPITDIEKIIENTPSNLAIGDDVTELLGVTKYELPLPEELIGKVRGNFPTHLVPKTDEIRIQSIIPEIFEEIDGKMFIVTEKIDGTSATYAFHNDIFYVCSRNLWLDQGFENKYWKISKKYNIENKLKTYFEQTGIHIAIQGEIAGPGIQKNLLNLDEIDLFVFNVYDITNRSYLDYTKMCDFCDTLGLRRVPTFTDQYVFLKDEHNLDYLLKMTIGNYKDTNNQREGLVYRPICERYSNTLKGRLSFKVINNSYLEGEE